MPSRRKFVQGAAGLALAPALFGSAISACDDAASPSPTATPVPTPPPAIALNGLVSFTLANYPELAAADGSASFDLSPLGAGRIILAHLGSATDLNAYVCVSRACTRDGCNVDYEAGTHGFRCPCDGSIWATDGAVLGGAPAPLHSYVTTFNGTTIVVNASS